MATNISGNFLTTASYDTIDGFGTIGGYAPAIIGLSGVTNVTIEQVTVTNLFGTWGIASRASTIATNTVVKNVKVQAARAIVFETSVSQSNVKIEGCIADDTVGTVTQSAGRRDCYSFGSSAAGSQVVINNCAAITGDANTSDPAYAVYVKTSGAPPTNAVVVNGLTIFHAGYTNSSSADFIGYYTNTVEVSGIVCSDGTKFSVVTNLPAFASVYPAPLSIPNLFGFQLTGTPTVVTNYGAGTGSSVSILATPTTCNNDFIVQLVEGASPVALSNLFTVSSTACHLIIPIILLPPALILL